MITFKELKDMAAKDAEIPEDSLTTQSLQTVKLYNKYQNIFYELANQLSNLKHEQNKVKLKVQRFWLGLEKDSVYQENPDKKKDRVLKTDVDTYIKADEVYIEATKKVEECELMANYVDQFLKQLSGRNFAIKNAIDYIKFKNGGY